MITVAVFVIMAAIGLRFLPAVFLRAAAAEGEALYDLDVYVDPVSGNAEFSFINVDIGQYPPPAVGYKSINILYPPELTFVAQSPLLSGWRITEDVNSGAVTRSLNVFITNPTAYGQPDDVKDFLENSKFVLTSSTVLPVPSPPIFPPAGAGVSVALSDVASAVYVDSQGYEHVYEHIDDPCTWLQAYNRARHLYRGTSQGYLATLTSIEEQKYVYSSVSTKEAWIGGSAILYSGVKLTAPSNPNADISENIANYDVNNGGQWYWACGPEDGLVFYTIRKTPNQSSSGGTNSEFNFFSNDYTRGRYPLATYGMPIPSGKKEPNNSNSGPEYCLTFAQVNTGTCYASWNDQRNTALGAGLGYLVEYGGTAAASAQNNIPLVILPTQHTVSFDAANPDYQGPVPADQFVWTRRSAVLPSELTAGDMYENYKVFMGWHEDLNDPAPFDFTSQITGDLTLYGKWETRLPPTPPPIPPPEPPPTPITPPPTELNAYGAYSPPVSESPAAPSFAPPPPSPTPTAARLKHLPYVIGYPGDEFHPDRAISRAETAAIFFNLVFIDYEFNNFNNIEFDDVLAFLDVGDSEWYSRAINYLAQINILNGYRDSRFRPNEAITRAEFATIAARYINASLNGDFGFADVSENHWARGYINAAVSNGWISGNFDAAFRPDSLITRAEAVTFINGALGRGLPKINVGQTMLYSDVPKNFWAYWDILEASRKHFYIVTGGAEDWGEY
jgi:hypothetical protein